ncbi:LVIVD repeat-containing protein [Phytoactinopolyspora endophytica]|uniref:LVIVD repeat-containing protein n=1 Tax=Phytoactinopolyspora endophytica TaxID=1642495 RepID=UPI00101BA034|nr:hypothetical protein [Phytoactinopolyspora endophytica]
MRRHPRQKSTRRGVLVAVSGVILALGFASASAHPGHDDGIEPRPGPHAAGQPDDVVSKNNIHDQHGPSSGHLPGSVENVELISSLRLTSFEEDISDVSALQTADGRWFAYVGDWGAHCETGGVRIVDFTDPENPTRAGNLNSPGFGYVTEGLQALSVDTAQFSGDLLVVSNEWCRTSGNPKNMPGGITLWDISEPTEPEKLVEAFGDFDLHGNRANESHSAIAWDTGEGNAYVAVIDNEEAEDVDLFDITDPRNPVLLAETELPGVNVNGFGDLKTAHDFDVLQFPDGTWHLMVSDWDAGWIDVDVTDPSNPVIVGDFDYAECDQVILEELGDCLQPEGNGHQGEWTSDGSVFVGTDEDFAPFRTSDLMITTGDHQGDYPAVSVGGAQSPASLEDLELDGPVVYGGYGCPDSAPIPSPEDVPGYLDMLEEGDERIVVLQRGPVGDPSAPEDPCFPGEKAHEAVLAGWDAVLFVQSHSGPEDPPFCGSGAFVDEVVGVCTSHEAFHRLFDSPPFTPPWTYPDGPEIGAIGDRIEVVATFDGWGYTRVVDTADPSMPTEIAQITIPETMDQDVAIGFGDLTVHEVEVPRGDPNEGGANVDDDLLAYFSWYAGGFRVVDISDPANPEEVGHYIDDDGSNFWGVALATDQNGDRIVLASDRDYGLFIFRYTGALPE